MKRIKKNVLFFLSLLLLNNTLEAIHPISLTLFSGYRYDSFFYLMDSYENQEVILNNALKISELNSIEMGAILQILQRNFAFSFEGSYAFVQNGFFQEEVLADYLFSYFADIKQGKAYHFDVQGALLYSFSYYSLGPEIGFFSDTFKITTQRAFLWNQAFSLLEGMGFNQFWEGFKAGCMLMRKTPRTTCQFHYFYLFPSLKADYILKNYSESGFSDHRKSNSGSGHRITLSFDTKFQSKWSIGLQGSGQRIQLNKGEAFPNITFHNDVIKKVTWENAELQLRINYYF